MERRYCLTPPLPPPACYSPGYGCGGQLQYPFTFVGKVIECHSSAASRLSQWHICPWPILVRFQACTWSQDSMALVALVASLHLKMDRMQSSLLKLLDLSVVFGIFDCLVFVHWLEYGVGIEGIALYWCHDLGLWVQPCGPRRPV